MRKVKGFTLMELSLAIAFISTILLIITAVVLNVSSNYYKGLAYKSINSTGRAIIEDLSLVVNSSPITNLSNICSSYYSYSESTSLDTTNERRKSYEDCVKDEGKNFIYQQYSYTIKILEEERLLPVFGAFCTGSYSYIWNTGYSSSSPVEYYLPLGDREINPRISLKYLDSGGSTRTVNSPRLLKISDPSRYVCANMTLKTASDRYSLVDGDSKLTENNYSILEADGDYKDTFLLDLTHIPGGTSFYYLPETPLELIAHSDFSSKGIGVFDFSVSAPIQDTYTKRLYYELYFTLGTLDGAINIKANDDYCIRASNISDTNFDKCAFAKFNFAKQATGE